MFFEGAEKKLELQLKSAAASLRQLPQPFWAEFVACANAEILSHIHNDFCDAYLLSESSLFVWDDRLLLLTCGKSTLVTAATWVIENLAVDDIASLRYQRKNEYQAQLQASTFADDISQLRHYLPGLAYRLGHLDLHHHYFFFAEHAKVSSDSRFELLMYHIRGELADYLNTAVQTEEGVLKRLQFDGLLNDFQFDSHCFSPFGFSLNGIRGEDYLSLHITPQGKHQDNCSYVSFETNLNSQSLLNALLGHLLGLFSPSGWDVIELNLPSLTINQPQYSCLSQSKLTTVLGTIIGFRQFQQCDTETLIPQLL
ncbi:adenosylmethionine decarboxylase [Shewanella acanthi]|uniref:adenosylmethionine decarboxylase n=1 Tax=Shewanella acanthi TaxID=2864212 RepID=UPI001C659AC1|nr:adenosylmethionine decarboxylase [Shewanella acanthi]QYJ80571.1 adenosylmethionine decarboxylase [Shewanella acanthi]